MTEAALSISLDCNDLDAQTRFWAPALGYEVLHRDELHVALGKPDRPAAPLPRHRGAIEGSCEWITMQDPEGNELCVERVTSGE